MTAIQKYLLTDESQSIRGGKYISKRVSSTSEEQNWINELNDNLKVCLEKGCNISKIDEYVYCYSSLSGRLPEASDLSFIETIKKPMFVSVNKLKNDMDLSLFYPFSLSIKDSNAFSLFICGYLSIYLFIDWGALTDIAITHDITMELIGEDYCLELKSKDGRAALSYTLTKALLEFTSLNWAIEQACKLYQEAMVMYENLDT